MAASTAGDDSAKAATMEPMDELDFESFAKEDAVKIVALMRRVADEEDQGVDNDLYKEIEVKMDKYLEQPTLLDPHLEDLVTPLMGCIRPGHTRIHGACRLVYCLCKTRGYKTVVKFLPHDVADLEPTYALLESIKQESEDADTANPTWETEYVLLVWLSMLVIVPFDLVTVDSSLGGDDGDNNNSTRSLIESIISTCKAYFPGGTVTATGAGLVLSRLLTRPDMGPQLQAFLSWSKEVLDGAAADDTGMSNEEVRLVSSVLACMCGIFKHGKRHEVLPHTEGLVDFIESFHAKVRSANALSNNLTTKIIQRIALLHLPPRIASWRYNRGMRTLESNIAAATAASTPSDGQGEGEASGGAKEQQQPDGDGNNANDGEDEDDDDDDDDFDCPDSLETVLDFLLTALKSRDTRTRWSAAKGLGRISSRLPRDFADEVVDGVLGGLDDDDSDTTWHGSCLAVAEMARRGVLMPERLPQAIPRVVQALTFEKRRGNFSVGAHVRDAACYVCWAFGRAYDPRILAPHVGDMACGLLVASCYDREVNCRRAASAAFQENVGRQGTFPHGIDILTRADYFTLGNRNNAYLDISIYIAGFDTYRQAMFKHLVDKKLNNWDRSVRRLASETLRRLAALDPEYAVAKVLPALVRRVTAMEPLEREGVLLGIAETLLGIYDAGRSLGGDGGDEEAGPAVLGKLQGLLPLIQKKRLYRGRGGEYVRAAVSRFIEAVGLTRVPFTQSLTKQAITMLEDNLRNPQEYIQESAVAAFAAFGRRFLLSSDDPASLPAADVDTLVSKYVKQAPDRMPNVSRGFSAVLGVLPPEVLLRHVDSVLEALTLAIRIQANPDARDAETRRNAITALLRASTAIARHSPASLTQGRVDLITGSVILSLDDYCVDKRGDVGSWVRIAVCEGLAQWISALDAAVATNGDQGAARLTASATVRVVGGLLRQLTGRLEKVRSVALKAIRAMLKEDAGTGGGFVSLLPHADRLREAFALGENEQQGRGGGMDRLVVLERCGALLDIDDYLPYILEGWVVCTDQVNGFKFSSDAVIALVRACHNLIDAGAANNVVYLLLRSIILMRPRASPRWGVDPYPQRLAGPAIITIAKVLEILELDRLVAASPECVVPSVLFGDGTLEPPGVLSATSDDGGEQQGDAWAWVGRPDTYASDAMFSDKPSAEDGSGVSVTFARVLERLTDELSTKLTRKDFNASVHAAYALCKIAFASGGEAHRSTALEMILGIITDHPWPRLRKLTADKFYIYLVVEDLPSKTGDSVADIVSMTVWSSEFEVTDSSRAALYAAVGVPLPPRQEVEQKTDKTAAGEGSTYADFIESIAMGVMDSTG